MLAVNVPDMLLPDRVKETFPPSVMMSKAATARFPVDCESEPPPVKLKLPLPALILPRLRSALLATLRLPVPNEAVKTPLMLLFAPKVKVTAPLVVVMSKAPTVISPAFCVIAPLTFSVTAPALIAPRLRLALLATDKLPVPKAAVKSPLMLLFVPEVKVTASLVVVMSKATTVILPAFCVIAPVVFKVTLPALMLPRPRLALLFTDRSPVPSAAARLPVILLAPSKVTEPLAVLRLSSPTEIVLAFCVIALASRFTVKATLPAVILPRLKAPLFVSVSVPVPMEAVRSPVPMVLPRLPKVASPLLVVMLKALTAILPATWVRAPLPELRSKMTLPVVVMLPMSKLSLLATVRSPDPKAAVRMPLILLPAPFMVTAPSKVVISKAPTVILPAFCVIAPLTFKLALAALMLPKPRPTSLLTVRLPLPKEAVRLPVILLLALSSVTAALAVVTSKSKTERSLEFWKIVPVTLFSTTLPAVI